MTNKSETEKREPGVASEVKLSLTILRISIAVKVKMPKNRNIELNWQVLPPCVSVDCFSTVF